VGENERGEDERTFRDGDDGQRDREDDADRAGIATDRLRGACADRADADGRAAGGETRFPSS
jgi:hypothetical protein